MSLGDIVEHSDRLRSRKERLRLARQRSQRYLRLYLTGPSPQGVHAQDAYEEEFDQVLDNDAKLARGEFPDDGLYDDLVPDGDYICEDCINGHDPDCDALRPEDLGDCLAFDCRGCCPNGCPEHGLPLEASKQGMKLQEMFGGLIKRFFR